MLTIEENILPGNIKTKKQKTVKKLITVIGVLFAGELITAFSMHLYAVIFDPRAAVDGQYPTALLVWAGIGLAGGVIMLFALKIMVKKRPEFTKTAKWVLIGYCAALVIITVAAEALILKPIGSPMALLMVGLMPFLFIGSITGIVWLVMMPVAFMAICLSVLVPLFIVLGLVYFFVTPKKNA